MYDPCDNCNKSICHGCPHQAKEKPIERGTLIVIDGNIYEYEYDNDLYHVVSEVLIDDEGRLTATYVTRAVSSEELKDNAVNFTQQQWCGIVEHFIRQDYDLSEEEISNAAEDMVYRCFAYGVPKLEELPKYIAEYLNR